MKKFLSSIAILATVLGMTSVAMAKSFTDVKNTKYEEAVNVLTELEIVNGYEDNTYKPNNSVKRSEMAKLIVVALGKEKSATTLEGTTSFSDVSSKHWASGYINVATSLGLIKGYPDGTFKPEATVSYVEASTMLLRALDYGKELDSLSWPTGYMSKAESAGILNNVTSNSSSDAAIRGNIASMVFNTLKANTRKVVMSNDTGNIYGKGQILLEKTFSNFVSVKKGTITDIDFDYETLYVKDSDNDRNIETLYTDTSNIKKLYGREVSFIYDNDAEDFLTFEIIDDLTVKSVIVDGIDEDKGLLATDDKKEYSLPKESNILFVGTSRYDDIESAYLTLDSKNKVVYAVLEGTEKIYAGIVTNASKKIDGKNGIEILNPSDDYVDLVLASSSAKVYTDDVILYTFNNDDKIVIKSLKDLDDALKIEDVTTSSIKLKGKDKITFSSTSKYEVFIVDGLSIREASLSSIDKQYDMAMTLKFGSMYYIIVYEDSVPAEDIETNVSVTNARKALNTALTSAKKKKEASYTVVTFERLRSAIDYGQKVYNASTSYSSAAIQLATKEINEAMSGLKTATAADKELRTAYSTLQTKIKEAKALDSKDYTAATFKAVTTAITEGEKISLASTTLAKVTAATEKIKSAINLLVTNASAEQIVNATNRLQTAINDAKAKKSTDYTDASFSNLTKMLDAANKVDRTTAGARELNNVASNLEAAIDALVQVELANYDKAKAELDANMKLASEKNEAAYTVSTWEEFETLYTVIDEDYDKLKKYDDIKILANADIKTETDKVKALNTRIVAALGKLVLKTDETLRNNSVKTIEKFITKAETYADEAAWNATNPAITWTALQEKLSKAKVAISKTSEYSTSQLQEMAMDLIQYISLD